MGLRFDPVGGGQFKQALKQIIEAERQPIRNLENRKGREDARLKLFNEFKGKFSGLDKSLAELSDFRKFRELKIDLGDGKDQMTVTVDKEIAEPGTYNLEIEKLASRSSVLSNGFKDPKETLLGIGYIVVYGADGEKFDVFVDEKNASLRGLESLINEITEAPVQASVIKDITNPDKPYKLILTAKKDGSDDGLDFPEFYFLDGKSDFYIDEDHNANNVLMTIDGFEIEGEGNKIKEFLKGVNVNLQQARPGQPFTMTISEDFQKMAGKVKVLVDQVNGILDFINKQNQVDEKSDTKTTFAGDTSLQAIEYKIRDVIHQPFQVVNPRDEDDVKTVFLSEIGIQFERNGQMSFKEDKFIKALESDFNRMSQIISGKAGFAPQMKQLVGAYTQTGNGLLGLREQSMRNNIKKIDSDIERNETRIAQRQQNLTEQFARLQGTLSNLQRQQSYLSATLGGGGGGNPIAQLLGG